MRTGHFLAGVGLLLFAVQASLAATLPNVNETGFGIVGQGASGIGSYDLPNQQGIQDVACGPTSVYNSFVFLQSRYGDFANLTLPGNASNTINQLAKDMNLVPKNGVSEAGFINGKRTYLTRQGLQNSISIESNDNAATMLQFIYDQLAKGQDVEIGMLWGGPNGGGHIVQVTGLNNFDPVAQTGTLKFNDPWGNAAGMPGGNGVPDGLSSLESGTLNGTMIQYDNNSGAGATPNGEDPGGGFAGGGFAGPGASATIAFAVAESPVPLPSTVWGGLALFACVAFVQYRNRSTARIA
jgi:hypothetical protein